MQLPRPRRPAPERLVERVVRLKCPPGDTLACARTAHRSELINEVPA